MIPVLRHCLPRDKIFVRWEDYPPLKAFIPLSGLPRLQGTRVDIVPTPIPYLHADPARAATWAEQLRRLAPAARISGPASSGPVAPPTTTTAAAPPGWRTSPPSPHCPA
jgi:hypothetical protein